MRDEFETLVAELTTLIQDSYEQGITMEAAEKAAGKFLYGQLAVADRLRRYDLDSRMKKAGLKAVKAAVYMDNVNKNEKKPSDTLLNALVDMDKLVMDEQKGFDSADAEHAALQNLFNIFKEGHIFMRGIAKGRFE